MMKKLLIFLITAFISQSKLQAQATFAQLEQNKIMYPSPTAASLGKYGEYPVSLYNGLVNIGQDIVTVKSGHLSLDVSLSYHASGNKPSDIPGWVGLGFSLNAGGVITRVVKDLPDDSPYGFYTANSSLQYNWNNYPDTHFLENYFNGTLDPSSDTYQFNFCGKAGEFVFDWDRNIHFKQQVPFKVELLGGSGGFAGFKITTDDGTAYTFDQAEHSNLSTMVINPPASSWYLTKIKNLSGDSIVFKYTAPTGHYRYKVNGLTRKEVYGTMVVPPGGVAGGEVETGVSVNQSSSMDEVIYLDEIDFTNGKLFFGKSTRTDPYYVPSGINPAYAEEKKLDLITLKDNSDNIIKSWKFEYYENSTERLKLKNLIARGSDQTAVQTYAFSYNPFKLPLPPSGPNPTNPYLCNDVDYWGYYNGAANGDNRIPRMYITEYNQYMGSANREIQPLYAQAEMLEKITYPTGGYTSFVYESNDYSDQGPSYAAAQNPMTYSSGTTDSYEFTYSRDDGGFEIDPSTITITLTESTHIHVQYSCGADGPIHEWANPGNYDYDYQLAAGTHTLASILNSSLLTSSTSADITKVHGWVTVYHEGPMLPYNAKTGPGVRIKSITTNDGATSTTRSFEYKTGLAQNTEVSSGYLSAFPAFYAVLQHIALNIAGFYITSDPINDIGEDAPISYSRVVERFSDNSFIVHNYTGHYLYPDEIMPFTNGFSNSKLAHMSSNKDLRGLESGTTYYNADGIIQKEILNSYEVLPASVTDVQCIEVKPTVGIVTTSISYVNASLTSLYNVHSRFIYSSSQSETTYDKNGQHPITTNLIKNYDNVKHLQPTRISTLASDGSSTGTFTTYPDDYALGVPFIDHMQTNHLTSFPIEQVVYKQKGDSITIVGGNMITYKAQGAALPEQLLKLETPTPISQANFKFSNRLMGVLLPSGLPSLFSADTHYQPELTYTAYDNKGNLLESVSRNGISTSYKWSYTQQYPIAEIKNAANTTVESLLGGATAVNSFSNSNPTDVDVKTFLAPLNTLAAAQTTTYTFKPLVGITSSTDSKGMTTYYEYDSFQRLQNIKDQNGNIIKRYDYHYKP